MTALLLDEVPSSLLIDTDQPRPQPNHTLADPMARHAQRYFHLLPVGYTDEARWEQPWPEPSKDAKHQMNLYDYYQSYVLVCPGCGHAWCKSKCTHPPIEQWSVRARWCEHCMEPFIKDQFRLFEGRTINGQHCPGTVLSFDDRLLGEGGDHETWQLCLFAMPPDLMWREVRLWCLFDRILNPDPAPTEVERVMQALGV